MRGRLSALIYDHIRHAGNAGDLWKHLILGEAVDHQLSTGLIYAESHAGYPGYILKPGGEWTSGIGRLWARRGDFIGFSYIQALERLNPSDLLAYPGSTCLAMMVAEEGGASLRVEAWDIDPLAGPAWSSLDAFPHDLRFHTGDGFSGVEELLEEEAGLLLIDPPLIERTDVKRSARLLELAANSGWTVLFWYMADIERPRLPASVETYSIEFAKAGLECGRWKEAEVAVSGSRGLCERIRERTSEFMELVERW